MIELHVHLEGTIDASLALRLAERHGVVLTTGQRLLLETPFSGGSFAAFVERWKTVGSLLRDVEDFTDVVVSYAARLAEQGCRYAEAIFSPAEPARRGVPMDTVFHGYCEGADRARDVHGVDIRFTPDITRSFELAEAEAVAEHAIRFRDRGVVGLGLGGFEAEYPPNRFAGVFARARDAGLPSVPHAGEFAGPESIRACIELLHADRIRHGVRAIEDPDLVVELAERRIVLDICPTANVVLGVIPSLEQHPLAALVEAGVLCSVSTDNPAIFATDLKAEHYAATALGVAESRLHAAAREGALGLPARGGHRRASQPEVVIRGMVSAELRAVEAHQRVGWDPGSVRGRLLVASLGEQAVAVVALVVVRGGTLIDALVVHESLRGQGVGTQLVRAALEASSGPHWLECRAGLAPWYELLGFRAVTPEDVDPSVRDAVGPNSTRPQMFMRKD